MTTKQLTVKEVLVLIIKTLIKNGLRVTKNPVTNTIDIHNKLSSDRIAVILANGEIRVSNGRYKANFVAEVKERYENLLKSKNISLPL